MKAERGLSNESKASSEGVPLGYCLCGQAAGHREIVFNGRLDARHDDDNPVVPANGHYCVPILGEDRLYGVINVYLNDAYRVERPEEVTFLSSVAGVLAGTIERKKAEEALRQSEERFDLAVRGSDAGIWDWNLRTDTVYFSPRWKSMLGHADDEIIGHYSEWEGRLHPGDRERALRTIRAYMEGRTTDYELEHRLRHKDGSYRWILARGAAVRDEDGRLTRMVGSHIDITLHKQTLEQLNDKLIQLQAAQRIQQSLLPHHAPRLPGADIAGFSCPAAYAGGDMYDYLPMIGGDLGIVIGDVSGHGIAAALHMASTHAFLRSLAQTCATIGEIMTRANHFVHEEIDPENFVTLMLVRFDPTSRTLTYANAGHPPGLVLDAHGQVKAELKSSRIALGIQDHLDFSVGDPITLQTGDLVVLITDGILDVESPGGDLFGSERVLDTIRAAQAGTCQEILDDLRRALDRHADTQQPRDDLTALVLKITE